MRLRIVSITAATIALACSVQYAQAGAIRFAGEEIGKGTAVVAQKTADVAGTAAGGAAEVGKTTGTVLKDGTVTLAKGAVWGPAKAVQGTKAAVSKLWSLAW